MRQIFVTELSNVQRFLDATRVLDGRGAPEAGWLLVEGDPGYGKTRTLIWYATHRTPIYVRAKRDWSPNWMLRDLAGMLGLHQSHRTEALFNAVLTELSQRGSFIIIDEIDHAAQSVRVLETLRDLTDMSETPLIAGGMRGARALMKRYAQIYSRLADIVTFGPASVEDVKSLTSAIAEVQIADDLAAEIQRRSRGRLREVLNAIARVEAFARKHRGPVGLADYGRRPLTNEDRMRPLTAPKEAADG